jgi:two-component system cell cycle sensor histidine kinase/response regulator CckA
VVAQSGGYIYIYSELGRGTTFDIYLPRVGAAGTRPKNDAEMGSTLRKTILVWDSDDTFRNLTVKLLNARDYRAIPASTAEQAAASLENDDIPVALLVVDATIAESPQGADLKNRAVARRPELPILYLTTLARDTIGQGGHLTENLEYLEKPFTTDDLMTRIREMLNPVKANDHLATETHERSEADR